MSYEHRYAGPENLVRDKSKEIGNPFGMIATAPGIGWGPINGMQTHQDGTSIATIDVLWGGEKGMHDVPYAQVTTGGIRHRDYGGVVERAQDSRRSRDE